jgi:hypothetical protein
MACRTTGTRHDNGGVHVNSGIPNHAFYLAATALGGSAWETDRLAPGDRRELAALVQRAGLLDAPAPPGPQEPGPDRFGYAVTVEDSGRSRTARFAERALPEEVRNLIAWVGAVEGRQESIGPPGG